MTFAAESFVLVFAVSPSNQLYYQLSLLWLSLPLFTHCGRSKFVCQVAGNSNFKLYYDWQHCWCLFFSFFFFSPQAVVFIIFIKYQVFKHGNKPYCSTKHKFSLSSVSGPYSPHQNIGYSNWSVPQDLNVGKIVVVGIIDTMIAFLMIPRMLQRSKEII